MGKLIYSMITSVDGYVSDRNGDFGWSAPDEESHRFIGERTRAVGTYLMGRRMYEVMSYWEAIDPAEPEVMHEFAGVWQAAGLVDEYQLILAPALVGGGTAFFPPQVRAGLELLESHVFGNGVVFLRYAVRT
ncbi:dihydrofolate reductase family protein [Paractinoplanes atraurantiacus]|uniref:Dihydrofolate reductase n=1 Tax=Paractinoplanes atraurantiacus TaxID=1036182 RepID=A0A285J5L6_9ACTN|nr:dihydrofolate reductase family protein [Actinoplanes atraurantiacus]SNY54391.1 Dihydrofolate reductase [Actinoplanes atraurantiacus]